MNTRSRGRLSAENSVDYTRGRTPFPTWLQNVTAARDAKEAEARRLMPPPAAPRPDSTRWHQEREKSMFIDEEKREAKRPMPLFPAPRPRQRARRVEEPTDQQPEEPPPSSLIVALKTPSLATATAKSTGKRLPRVVEDDEEDLIQSSKRTKTITQSDADSESQAQVPAAEHDFRIVYLWYKDSDRRLHALTRNEKCLRGIPFYAIKLAEARAANSTFHGRLSIDDYELPRHPDLMHTVFELLDGGICPSIQPESFQASLKLLLGLARFTAALGLHRLTSEVQTKLKSSAQYIESRHAFLHEAKGLVGEAEGVAGGEVVDRDAIEEWIMKHMKGYMVEFEIMQDKELRALLGNDLYKLYDRVVAPATYSTALSRTRQEGCGGGVVCRGRTSTASQGGEEGD